jgi:hypothetical protein
VQFAVVVLLFCVPAFVTLQHNHLDLDPHPTRVHKILCLGVVHLRALPRELFSSAL